MRGGEGVVSAVGTIQGNCVMELDPTAEQAFARKWPLWRVIGLALFFAFTVVAMWIHHPTEWFVIPAAMAVQECLRDWRDARREKRTFHNSGV